MMKSRRPDTIVQSAIIGLQLKLTQKGIHCLFILLERRVGISVQYDCNASLSGKSQLRKHVFSIHKADSAVKYQCDFCEKRYTTKYALQEHNRSVHQGIRVTCDFCEKSFVLKSTLKRHILLAHITVHSETFASMFKQDMSLQCRL